MKCNISLQAPERNTKLFFGALTMKATIRDPWPAWLHCNHPLNPWAPGNPGQ